MPHLSKIFPCGKRSRIKWRLDCVLSFACGRFIWPSTRPDIFSSWGWSSCCSSHTVQLPLLFGRSNLKNGVIVWAQVTLLCPGPRHFPPWKCVSAAARQRLWPWLSSVKRSSDWSIVLKAGCVHWGHPQFVSCQAAAIPLPASFLSLFIAVIFLRSEVFMGGVTLAETGTAALHSQNGLKPSTGSSNADLFVLHIHYFASFVSGRENGLIPQSSLFLLRPTSGWTLL